MYRRSGRNDNNHILYYLGSNFRDFCSLCSDTAFAKSGKAKMSMPGSAKSGKAGVVDAKAEKVSTPKMSSKLFPTTHSLLVHV